MGFADAIDQEELVSWATTLNSSDETETAASAEGSKKSVGNLRITRIRNRTDRDVHA